MTQKDADLDWRPHPKGPGRGEQAIHTFPNGLRVSVLRNNPMALTDDGTYELYLIAGPMVDPDADVPEWLKREVDWQTEDQANAILAEMEAFAP